MNRWHFIFVLILIFGGVWLWESQVPLLAQTINRTPQPAIGYPAPDFTLKTLDGKSFNLREHRGTPVVLNFWATWCGPCQAELPAVEATFARYTNQVQVIGVDQAEAPDVVQAYVKEFQLTYPIAMDKDSNVANHYNVKGMPTTFFIDGDGVIRHMWMGEMNRITLAEGVTKILR